MKMYKSLMTFTGIISVFSVYGIYKLGRLHFLPVWNGGPEDKTFISLGLLFCLAIFLMALEHFLTLAIGTIRLSLRSQTFVNFSSLTTIIKAALFPFKCIAYLSSMVIASSLFSMGGGVVATLFIGYLYFFKLPVLNEFVNKKIVDGFTDETKFN
ncbi:hypothetical protein J7S78_13755 [Klebsiella oxytoca]|uniref:Uncharacterized protein n=1 Tax=Klebsiella oxytoca TaxID=571 RepID=A0AAP2BJR4_KLEOX|nr:hypothetical protein [Klebsiella oxytoca]MBQ0600858.1 hypothetical protein [Klebsiella oxytoca]